MAVVGYHLKVKKGRRHKQEMNKDKKPICDASYHIVCYIPVTWQKATG